MSGRKGQTIIAIDALRFACAMLVVVYHFGVAYWRSPSPHGAVLLAATGPGFAGTPIARVGWVGVELFFVISGIVIARSAQAGDRREFLTRRTLRLAPAAWVCATITAATLTVAGLGGIGGAWVRSVAFWPIGIQIDGSFWTLGVELVFYLLVALAIGASDPRRVERIGIALGLASAGFWLAWLVGDSALTIVPEVRTVQLTLLPHGCFFAIGMLIAGMERGVTPARIAALALLTATGVVEIVQHVHERATHGVASSAVIAIAIFLAGLALLLAAGRLQPLLARVIDPGVARTIGLMTYPLYLLHQDLGAAMLAVLVRAGLSVTAATAVALLALLALSWLIATAIEPAVRRPLAALLSRFRAPAPNTRPSAFPRAG